MKICQTVDECKTDDVPDREVHRPMVWVRDIRLDLELTDAPKVVRVVGPDVPEVFS